MSRSKWKGPSIEKTFLKKKTIIMSRRTEIIPKFVGFNFNIYNGKNYINLKIKESMISHKFGEFSLTRSKK